MTQATMHSIPDGKRIKISYHIDGNAANNWENNLRLVSHSQLDTSLKNKKFSSGYRRIT